MELWEILVPTIFNDHRPIKLAYHKVWDEKVREIAGGLTIMKPAKGMWESDNGVVYAERMIPVRVAVESRDQIDAIVKMTIDHYEQLAIMAHKVSDDVIFEVAPKDLQIEWTKKNKIGMKSYDWIEVE